MPKETLSPPRYKHFTLDPLRPVGADVDDERNVQTLDDVPPSAAFNEEEAEQVKALSDAHVEAYEDRREQERKEAEDRAKAGAPKPSELLAAREGRTTKKGETRESTKSDKASSKS